MRGKTGGMGALLLGKVLEQRLSTSAYIAPPKNHVCHSNDTKI